jgi:drug/metabolite transporter (DMT)-like permease
MIASLIVYAPLFFIRLPASNFPPDAWIYILATGILHAMYFSTLGMAYRTGDLSKVYPLARGSAPLLVVSMAAFFLEERISLLGGLAIFLVVAGIFLIHIETDRGSGWRSFSKQGGESAVRWALATGLLSAVYSVVDKAGVARVSPEIYIYLMFFLTSLFLAPYHLRNGSTRLARAGYRDGRTLFRVLLGGVFTMGAYGLVLFAMRMSKVSYVVAAREVSVILGAGLGVFVLKEGGKRQKLMGAGLVAAGLALLTLSR